MEFLAQHFFNVIDRSGIEFVVHWFTTVLRLLSFSLQTFGLFSVSLVHNIYMTRIYIWIWEGFCCKFYSRWCRMNCVLNMFGTSVLIGRVVWWSKNHWNFVDYVEFRGALYIFAVKVNPKHYNLNIKPTVLNIVTYYIFFRVST